MSISGFMRVIWAAAPGSRRARGRRRTTRIASSSPATDGARSSRKRRAAGSPTPRAASHCPLRGCRSGSPAPGCRRAKDPMITSARGARGVGRREQRGHRAALAHAEHRGALGADGVEHRAHVVHALLERRDPGDAVRQPGAALVEQDQAAHAREPLVEARDRGPLPAGLEAADPAVHEHDVQRPVADDLVGDREVAARRRSSRRAAPRRGRVARREARTRPDAASTARGRGARPTARCPAARRASRGTRGRSPARRPGGRSGRARA